MLNEDFLVAFRRGASVDCEGLGVRGADGVLGLVDGVVLDVQDWPGLGAPSFEQVLDVLDEFGGGAGSPFGIAFHHTMLEIDDEEDGRFLGFFCHGDGCWWWWRRGERVRVQWHEV